MALDLGVQIPYAEMHDREATAELARVAEDAGFDSLWVSELYSFDVFTSLTHLALATSRIRVGTNVANVYARTPAMLASTAASLDQISAGRLILGIGVSGPQVVEGWHGVPYEHPLARTAETITVVRAVLRREKLHLDGNGSGVPAARGLRLINPPLRADVPIYVAAIGPRNVELAAAVGDGWLPILFSTVWARDVFGPSLEAGFARSGRTARGFGVMPLVPAFLGDRRTGLDLVRLFAGFYIGGMGSREVNFYNRLAGRYGYEEEAARIQDLFLSGRKQEAFQAVPDALADEISLVGDEARIRDRLDEFAAAGATGIILAPLATDPDERTVLVEAVARANT
jgi:F420-dependent oxidoreductase-like protein